MMRTELHGTCYGRRHNLVRGSHCRSGFLSSEGSHHPSTIYYYGVLVFTNFYILVHSNYSSLNMTTSSSSLLPELQGTARQSRHGSLK